VSAFQVHANGRMNKRYFHQSQDGDGSQIGMLTSSSLISQHAQQSS